MNILGLFAVQVCFYPRCYNGYTDTQLNDRSTWTAEVIGNYYTCSKHRIKLRLFNNYWIRRTNINKLESVWIANLTALCLYTRAVGRKRMRVTPDRASLWHLDVLRQRTSRSEWWRHSIFPSRRCLLIFVWRSWFIGFRCSPVIDCGCVNSTPRDQFFFANLQTQFTCMV